MILPTTYDAAVPIPQITQIVNAADQTQPVAPGGLVNVMGSGLSLTNIATSQVPTPTALGQSCLTVNGVSMPLFLVSSTQVNAQLPFNLDGNSQMVLRTPGGVSNNLNFTILPTAPSVFHTADSSPSVFRSANSAIVSDGNPVQAGDELIIYATGLGQTSPAAVTGAAAPANAVAMVQPAVALGGMPLGVDFAGLSAGAVGVYEIHVSVPSSIAGGEGVPLTIQQGGSSTMVNLQVADSSQVTKQYGIRPMRIYSDHRVRPGLRAAFAAVALATAAWGGTFGRVVPIGGEASDIALDEPRGVLYIANFAGNRIDVMKTSDFTIPRSINVNPLPGSIALSRDGQYLLIAHYGNFAPPASLDASLTLINLNTNTIQSLSVPAAPLAVAFGADGLALVVTTAEVDLLDPASGIFQTLATISVSLNSTALPARSPNFPVQITQSTLGVSGNAGCEFTARPTRTELVYDVPTQSLGTFPTAWRGSLRVRSPCRQREPGRFVVRIRLGSVQPVRRNRSGIHRPHRTV